MSVEEARHLLSKDEMRKAIADEAVDEVTNDHNPSEKLDNIKFYADHFVEEMVEALGDGDVVVQEVITEKSYTGIATRLKEKDKMTEHSIKRLSRS
jgi:hypothetical protein